VTTESAIFIRFPMINWWPWCLLVIAQYNSMTSRCFLFSYVYRKSYFFLSLPCVGTRLFLTKIWHLVLFITTRNKWCPIKHDEYVTYWRKVYVQYLYQYGNIIPLCMSLSFSGIFFLISVLRTTRGIRLYKTSWTIFATVLWYLYLYTQ
jgi:hypothetical protein